ncbi:MAG: AGE family epimerase/isomerase [Planctomycetota bacterium]
MLTQDRIDHLIAVYRDGLLGDTLPFWMEHSVDREYGGFIFCRGRDGSIIDTDKGIGQQGRFAWLLATLYNTVQKYSPWLRLARHGIDFVRQHGFDSDGSVFAVVTREGEGVSRCSDRSAEAALATALAAYARATGDTQAQADALRLFDRVKGYRHATLAGLGTSGCTYHEGDLHCRPLKHIDRPIALLATAQVLRDNLEVPEVNSAIDSAIQEIERDFVRTDLRVVLDATSPSGEFVDHFSGRTLKPGRALHACSLILQEAKARSRSPQLLELGLKMLDWTWKRGWDEEYGGILHASDARGMPLAEPGHDLKLWWPQTEATIATLLAYQLTGDVKYAAWHTKVHDWAHAHFPDPEHGEWFASLHRDGRPSLSLKGSLWKDAFHVPRMQWTCWRLAEEIQRPLV